MYEYSYTGGRGLMVGVGQQRTWRFNRRLMAAEEGELY